MTAAKHKLAATAATVAPAPTWQARFFPPDGTHICYRCLPAPPDAPSQVLQQSTNPEPLLLLLLLPSPILPQSWQFS